LTPFTIGTPFSPVKFGGVERAWVRRWWWRLDRGLNASWNVEVSAGFADEWFLGTVWDPFG
jgi:hypothetical protein